MDTLSIRLKIGAREYPMRVKMEDEAKIRHAGKLINEKLKKYKEEFGLDDIQDLLAMVAFDCMVESLESNEVNAEDSTKIQESLSQINSILSSSL